jgi:hypothetical protein
MLVLVLDKLSVVVVVVVGVWGGVVALLPWRGRLS